jgi:hypothetical protein
MLAFLTSILSACVVLAFYGNPEAGVELLNTTKIMAFAAIIVGGFCFPVRFRSVHSTVLLMFGLSFYCATEQVVSADDSFLQMHPFPLFWSLAFGGVIAVVFQGLTELVSFVKREHIKQE